MSIDLDACDLSPERLEIAKYIAAKLGGSAACVELANPELRAVIEDAELWLLVHMAPVHEADFTMVAGQSEYTVLPDVEVVCDVVFSSEQVVEYESTATLDPFGGNLPWRGAGPYGYGRQYPQSSRMQVLQAAESAARVLSLDPIWDWNRFRRVLTIRPSTMRGPARYTYTAKAFDHAEMSATHKMLFRAYAVAQAKMTLGNIRSKYSEYPAAGSKVTLNGDQLIGQAQEELQVLDEKVKQLAVPMWFTTG